MFKRLASLLGLPWVIGNGVRPHHNQAPTNPPAGSGISQASFDAEDPHLAALRELVEQSKQTLREIKRLRS